MRLAKFADAQNQFHGGDFVGEYCVVLRFLKTCCVRIEQFDAF